MGVESSSKIAGQSTKWRNWSGNIQYDGQNYYFKPVNKPELQSVLADAKSRGTTVRVSGQRHSQPPLVASDNRNQTSQQTLNLIDMSCYVDLANSGMELGPGKNQVTVNPGVREDDLDAFLTKNNLMMKTVTAGGFFSIGGMTAVDVHGGTINGPIFAETVSAFTIMDADGQEQCIDSSTKDDQGNSVLSFARVSLGALGVVTRIVIDVVPRPYANTLQGGKERYLLKDKAAFTAKFKEFLNGPSKHARMETFYTPYAAAKNLPFLVPDMKNFLVLWWDEVDNPSPPIPNSAPTPPTACALSDQGDFGAPLLGGLASYGVDFVRKSQYFDDAYSPLHVPPVPPSGFAAIALDEIESQVEKANAKHSDLWLHEAAQVMFMSYFIELPALDDAGLGIVWDGLQIAGDYVIEDDNFHIAAPMEFRFVKGGDSAMAGTYTNKPDSWFINLDLIGFVEPTTGAEYPEALLKFFATVERKWVEMGGIPHNGKMYGFYDPQNADSNSFTPPFNKSFLSFITQKRIERGAPVEAFKKFRKTRDPDNRFFNKYLQNLLGD